MINWKNTTENLIIVIVGFLAGALMGAGIMYVSLTTIIKSNERMVTAAINKATTETSNNINKVKSGRKSTLELDMTNQLDTIAKKRRFLNFLRK